MIFYYSNINDVLKFAISLSNIFRRLISEKLNPMAILLPEASASRYCSLQNHQFYHPKFSSYQATLFPANPSSHISFAPAFTPPQFSPKSQSCSAVPSVLCLGSVARLDAFLFPYARSHAVSTPIAPFACDIRSQHPHTIRASITCRLADMLGNRR